MGAAQAPSPHSRANRTPRWAKFAAVPVTLGVIAALNLHAAAADRRHIRLAADRIDATIVQVGGTFNLGELVLGVVVTNLGNRSLALHQPRVASGGFALIPTPQPTSVASGSAAQVNVHLQATCPVSAAATVRLVVPVAAASGRVRELSVTAEPQLVDDLHRRACGDIPALEAIETATRFTGATRYSVSFAVSVTNRSKDPFTLLDITSPGLALGLRGGTPVVVPPHQELPLEAVASLPACSRLPAGRVGNAGRFGSLLLLLRDTSGRVQPAPYIPEPGDQLYPALLALRSRICPGITGPPNPSGIRPRGVG